MNRLARPFAALRPRPETAQAVIAPPYDVFDLDEAREIVSRQPQSFVRVSRPEVDLPAGTDPHTDVVYARGRHNLHGMIQSGILARESCPSYYIYRMRDGSHVQTGIAFAASVAAYEAGLIHRHEATRPDKETDRVRNIDALNAQTGPVLLTFTSAERIETLVREAAAGLPLLEAEGPRSVIHSIWRVEAEDAVDEITRAIDALDELYIADGHHRSAAAARVAENRRGTGLGQSFLSVAFPDTEMRIFDYNRVVRDLNGMAESEFLAAVAGRFEIERTGACRKPDRPGRFAMYLGGEWFRLTAARVDETDPVGSLDVSVLQQQLLSPLLGIGDPRTDPRIDFVGGIRGIAELERSVDCGRAAAAFALYPTSIDQLIAVAAAGLLMPPKSTWFEPKLADGLLTLMLDE